MAHASLPSNLCFTKSSRYRAAPCAFLQLESPPSPQPRHVLRSPIPFLFIYFFHRDSPSTFEPDSCDLGLQNAGSLVRRVASTHVQESGPMHSEQDACPSCGDSSVFGSSFHPLMPGVTWNFVAWVLRPAAPCNGRQRQHQHYA